MPLGRFVGFSTSPRMVLQENEHHGAGPRCQKPGDHWVSGFSLKQWQKRLYGPVFTGITYRTHARQAVCIADLGEYATVLQRTLGDAVDLARRVELFEVAAFQSEQVQQFIVDRRFIQRQDIKWNTFLFQMVTLAEVDIVAVNKIFTGGLQVFGQYRYQCIQITKRQNIAG